ncbi:S24 family peptidase [Oleidesulfovibrio sp.]|uniref:S24 family peptidase n=1 Tax=Oleidesulfovibrio sp. TaxID=2909707 RepID=UPI003A8B137E
MQAFIEDAIRLLGGVSDVASAAGVSHRTVYAWKNGERFPSRSKLSKLSSHLERLAGHNDDGSGLKEQEVARDSGGASYSVREAASPQYGPADGGRASLLPVPPRADLLGEFVFVAKADARPSAGGGSLQTGAETVERHAFRLDWLLSKTHDTTSLRLMEVMGRSMEPTLHNGDHVLVNEGDTYLIEDRVYVVRVQDEIYIKRFARTPGKLLFRGDNRELAYQDIEVDPQDQACDWTVIGRVIWAGKEL